MKSRLSSTIWMLVFFIGLDLFGVLGLAYYAGAHSGAQAAEGGPIPGGANGALVLAAGLALVGAVSMVMILSKRVLTPVEIELLLLSAKLLNKLADGWSGTDAESAAS